MLLHATSLYSATGTLLVLLGFLLLARYIVRATTSPLRDLPGPPLARFTRLWEVYNNWQGKLEHVMIALHRRHGSSSYPLRRQLPTNTCKARLSAWPRTATASAIQQPFAPSTVPAPSSASPISTALSARSTTHTRTSFPRRATQNTPCNADRLPTCTR